MKTMGMKYEVIFPNDHLWGTKLPNGSWTGMIGDLANNVSGLDNVKTSLAVSFF